MKSVYFLISLFAAAWVFYDAKTRGRDNAVAFLWCLGTQLLVIVFRLSNIFSVNLISLFLVNAVYIFK
jgi:hypothetical protein